MKSQNKIWYGVVLTDWPILLGCCIGRYLPGRHKAEGQRPKQKGGNAQPERERISFSLSSFTKNQLIWIILTRYNFVIWFLRIIHIFSWSMHRVCMIRYLYLFDQIRILAVLSRLPVTVIVFVKYLYLFIDFLYLLIEYIYRVFF